MQDKTVLSHVKRLSAVNGRKDIMPLSWVTYPGTHCPLFGAALTVRQYGWSELAARYRKPRREVVQRMHPGVLRYHGTTAQKSNTPDGSRSSH